MAVIHPSAIISPQAQIASDVEIGPYCTIGPDVVIGSQSRLISHVVIDGDTTLGTNNLIYPFSTIGLQPQDLKYKGEASKVEIGNNNTFRESCTVHRGTLTGNMLTKIGDNNLFMAYAHVAHDSIIHNHVIMANSSALAGHVTVDDYARLGGLSGVHQFCRIGKHAFLAGGAKVTMDVPPYCTAHGDRAKIVGFNLEGLRRIGWSKERIIGLKTFLRSFFADKTPTSTKIAALQQDDFSDDIQDFLTFIKTSERGFCPFSLNSSE